MDEWSSLKDRESSTSMRGAELAKIERVHLLDDISLSRFHCLGRTQRLSEATPFSFWLEV